jgi:glycosyltransferase involved in cell wall biosynthesis
MISVVIPLYNKEKSITSTLQSVLDQTYTDWECIIINDGSTDNSLEVVSKRVRELESERIRVIHQENSGVSAARNKGIAVAKGEYIAFLDADDYWVPEVLSEYAQLIHDFPNASLYALGCGSIIGGVRYPCRNKIQIGDRGYIENIWDKDPSFLITASCCCCSRELAHKIGGFDTRMTHGEDYDLWWRLLFVGPLAFCNKTLVYYVEDAENRAMNRNPVLEKYIPYYIDKYKEERVKNVCFRRFCDEELARRLYPYLLDRKTSKKAKELLREIDWTLLKPSLKWRMRFPHLYALYKGVKCKV